METTRQQKISRLIQKVSAEFFRLESHNLFEGAMITVTKVYVTKDLAIARIYLSLFSTRDKTNLLLSVKQHTREIRRHVGNVLRNQLRIIPELEFHEDDSLDYIDNIDRLLHP
ncbi:MAG: 30S ribosome-binding factor RbfA [Bacteroidales bacterium]|nr:30S ribosome-binding factor RbfA [Lentimicrobiaceae bacterium]MDD5695110.1 30S ribosome-binding factor RbfA [Bacteroidales bacterium]